MSLTMHVYVTMASHYFLSEMVPQHNFQELEIPQLRLIALYLNNYLWGGFQSFSGKPCRTIIERRTPLIERPQLADFHEKKQNSIQQNSFKN